MKKTFLSNRVRVVDMAIADYGKKGTITGEVLSFGVHKGEQLVRIDGRRTPEFFKRSQIKPLKFAEE